MKIKQDIVLHFEKYQITLCLLTLLFEREFLSLTSTKLTQLERHESINTRGTTVLEFHVQSLLEVNFLLEFTMVFTMKQYKMLTLPTWCNYEKT